MNDSVNNRYSVIKMLFKYSIFFFFCKFSIVKNEKKKKERIQKQNKGVSLLDVKL